MYERGFSRSTIHGIVTRKGGRSPRRPKGILLLAIVCFLMAGSFALIGILFAVTPTTLRPFGFRLNPDGSARLSGLFVFGATGVLIGSVGYGLWRLKRWAHFFVMFSASTTLIRGLVGAFADDATPTAQRYGAALVLSVAVLSYFVTPHVRAAFGGWENVSARNQLSNK